MDVQLTLLNELHADQLPDVRIVLYQKNILQRTENPELLVAWRVFQLNEELSGKRFHVSSRLAVAAIDTKGTVCDQHLTDNGQFWQVMRSRTKDWMILGGNASSDSVIEIKNSLSKDEIAAQIYRDGRLLAVSPGLRPGALAGFAFDETVYFAFTTARIQEGDRLPPRSQLFGVTELHLSGFSKARLLLTGSGSPENGHYNCSLMPEKSTLVA